MNTTCIILGSLSLVIFVLACIHNVIWRKRISQVYEALTKLNRDISSAPISYDEKVACWDRWHNSKLTFRKMARRVYPSVDEMVEQLRTEVFQDVLDNETNV